MSSDFVYPNIFMVGLTSKMHSAFREANRTPDFDALLGNHEGVRLVEVLSKVRSAIIEISSEEAFHSLKEKIGGDYILSPRILFEPF